MFSVVQKVSVPQSCASPAAQVWAAQHSPHCSPMGNSLARVEIIGRGFLPPSYSISSLIESQTFKGNGMRARNEQKQQMISSTQFRR